ncbi:MAG: phosphoglucosamine mutase [Cellvibrionales bacterium]|nr:phosphoglucosamine mutase [Cellvibrionales bacterium]
MPSPSNYFGTDGIRGTVGQPPITADFMLKLGWALGRVLADTPPPRRVMLGKDTRASGYMFESALQAGLIAAGTEVGLLGPMPTPAIAWLTRTFKAQAGIVISASHNPYPDNGIKFFSATGHKLDAAMQAQIAAALDQPFATVGPAELGRAFRVTDASGRYIEHCKSTLPADFQLSGLKLVLDCAHGATYQTAPQVFAELGAELSLLGTAPDGRNINRGCGATDTAALQRKVVAEGAHLGIAFDGDGDRVQFVDSAGQLADGDQLLYIIACHRHAQGGLKGLVGTGMSNFGLERAMRDRGVQFHRAKVGDRHVSAAMQKLGYSLGGEPSGHIICAEAGTTGDGVVAALQVLLALAPRNWNLPEATFPPCPQALINVPIHRRLATIDDADVLAQLAEVKTRLASGGRVLLRPSGTEPLIRIMVAGEDPALVDQCAADLAATVRARYA